ncbi:MAG: thioredoxin-disulfide reductase [Pseudomonadota bacterium]
MTDILIYTRDVCPYCNRAKALLSAKGQTYREINVTHDAAAKAEMIERSGRRTMPQIFIDGDHVGGFDDLSAEDASGALDTRLGLEDAKGEDLASSIVIIGSGPAGLSAAIYAARAGHTPIVVTGDEAGGQLTTTTEVENWPGGPEGLQGQDLIDQLTAHAERAGAKIVTDTITAVDSSRRPFILTGRRNRYHADSVIVATGATARYLGLDSEATYLGRGVSACATCDGFFFKDQTVAVVGGGNSAVEEALYLTSIARHVTLIHRRDTLKAERVLQDRLFEKAEAGDVTLLWHHEVGDVLGDADGVTGLELRDARTGETHILPVDGLFVAIGHDPNTALFKDTLEMTGGYITTGHATEAKRDGAATQTSVPGIFAAGDVSDPVYMQAITSSALGAMAALDADKYLTREGLS